MAIKIVKDSPELRRLHVAFEDWRKNQPWKQRGLLHLSKLSGIPYSNLQYQLSGNFKMSDKLINFFVIELGYRYEWIMANELPRKKKENDTDKKKPYIDMLKAMAQIESLRAEVKVERIRRTEIEKEIGLIKAKLNC